MFKVSSAGLQACPPPRSKTQHSTVDWSYWQFGHVSMCTLGHDNNMIMQIQLLFTNTSA